MEYWQNQVNKAVYGFDISDPTQIAAKNKITETGTWDNITGSWPPPPAPPTAEQNKEYAMSLLANTDWVNNPDVYNTEYTPHLLNRSDFISYRLQVRQFAVNPVGGNLNWPVKPTEQWSS